MMPPIQQSERRHADAALFRTEFYRLLITCNNMITSLHELRKYPLAMGRRPYLLFSFKLSHYGTSSSYYHGIKLVGY